MSQSNVQTAKAPKARKVQLLPVTADDVNGAAKSVGRAIEKVENAKRDLLVTTANAIKAAKVTSMSAKQFDRQFRPAVEAAMASLVKRGKVTESTGKTYVSKLKTAFLGLANGFEPRASETLWEYVERASTDFIPTATLGDGSPVWEAQTKRGPKAGKPKGRKGGSLPGAVADANASAATADDSGFDRSPAMAAALILTRQNERRAQLLVAVMQTHGEQFDRWAAAQLTPEEAKALAPKADKPKVETVTVTPDVPGTALADALVKAERKRQQKPTRKAA